MEIANFLELIGQFETQLKKHFKFELLESLYTPYAFGSGMTAYRIRGRNVRLIFDGRDNQVELMISSEHVKYPTGEWTTVFSGTQLELIENAIVKLQNELIDNIYKQ